MLIITCLQYQYLSTVDGTARNCPPNSASERHLYVTTQAPGWSHNLRHTTQRFVPLVFFFFFGFKKVSIFSCSRYIFQQLTISQSIGTKTKRMSSSSPLNPTTIAMSFYVRSSTARYLTRPCRSFSIAAVTPSPFRGNSSMVGRML